MRSCRRGEDQAGERRTHRHAKSTEHAQTKSCDGRQSSPTSIGTGGRSCPRRIVEKIDAPVYSADLTVTVLPVVAKGIAGGRRRPPDPATVNVARTGACSKAPIGAQNLRPEPEPTEEQGVALWPSMRWRSPEAVRRG